MLWLWIAIPTGIVIAIWLYNFIEGKTLVRDTLDEAQLRRASLKDLDREWARYSNYQPRRRKRFYDRTSLGWINRRGEDAESTNHSVVVKHFADRWMVSQPAASAESQRVEP